MRGSEVVGQWTDAKNHDLRIDTSEVDLEETTELIECIGKKEGISLILYVEVNSADDNYREPAVTDRKEEDVCIIGYGHCTQGYIIPA